MSLSQLILHAHFYLPELLMVWVYLDMMVPHHLRMDFLYPFGQLAVVHRGLWGA